MLWCKKNNPAWGGAQRHFRVFLHEGGVTQTSRDFTAAPSGLTCFLYSATAKIVKFPSCAFFPPKTTQGPLSCHFVPQRPFMNAWEHMRADLTFQAMILPALERGGGLWIRSTDLARALGYGREDKVARLYSRHADEFTNSMTQLLGIVVEPHFGGGGKSGEQSLPLSTRGIDNLSSGRMRIFSLRGSQSGIFLRSVRTPYERTPLLRLSARRGVFSFPPPEQGGAFPRNSREWANTRPVRGICPPSRSGS